MIIIMLQMIMTMTMFLIMVKVVSFPVRDHPSGRPFSELSDHEDDIDVGDVDDDRDGVCYQMPTLRMPKCLLGNLGYLL